MLEKLASVLERRFLLNAFVPAGLFFGAYGWLALWATGNLDEDLRTWEHSPLSTKLLLGAAFFGLTWFAAGFLASQWRNLIRLYEGYLFAGPLKLLDKLGRTAHRTRRAEFVAAGRPTYYDYPMDPDAVLPTRLGNTLRAAEYYATERYGADYLVLWTRLGHLVPDRAIDDMEEYRAQLEFLIVAATWFGAFALAGATTCAANGHGAAVFLAILIGGYCLAYIAYTSAIQAAIEYGEAMRASFDLFRHELLVRLRWEIPTTPEDEAIAWQEIHRFIVQNAERTSPYSKAWVDLDPERFL